MNVILTDCDGVLLDWESSFVEWMAIHGHYIVKKDVYDISEMFGITKEQSNMYTRFFNESSQIGYLNPLRDSMYYIDLLHKKHGYTFHVITSLSNNEYSQKARTENLKRIFGETAITKFIYLDCGANKDLVLSKYKDTNLFWVEDKPENAIAGYKLGLKSILMAHGYNQDSYPRWDSKIPRVNNWQEFYDVYVA